MDLKTFEATMLVMGFKKEIWQSIYVNTETGMRIRMHQNLSYAMIMHNKNNGWRTLGTVIQDIKKFRDMPEKEND